VRALRQTVAVTLLSLRTIPQRLGASLVAVVGIAGVVVVFVAVLSIAAGFRAALDAAGAPDRAIILRTGADNEMMGGFGIATADIVKQAPGILHVDRKPMAAAEVYVVIDVNKRATHTAANVPLRGIEPASMQVRPEITIGEGRMFQFGTDEAIVGRSATHQFEGLAVGSRITSGQVSWNVVGIFDAGGSVSETEIWCDAHRLQDAYRRGNSYQSVLAKLDSPASFEAFKNWLTTNPQIEVDVEREPDFYAKHSRVLTIVVQTLGFGIAGLMGLGAIFGAVLTMYTAVATRTREIATLRALGFGALPVVVSVIAESLSLAALGGIAGGLAAYVGFNGYQAATMNWQTFSQVAFKFAVTPALLGQGLVGALVMGFLGGLLPALRAARLPITSALREL
jgi:putative ABC transport system permease protein